MKKILSITFLFALFLSVQSFSQSSNYGITAGYNNFIISASVDGIPGSGSNGASGYYIGVYGDFELGNKFSLQPELQFGQVFNEGNSGEMLILPVMFKYYIVEKFNIEAGPVLDYMLDNEDEEISDFGLGLGFGGAFHINKKLSVTTRYSLGLTNRTPDVNFADFSGGDPAFINAGLNTKFDYFQVGLSYKF